MALLLAATGTGLVSCSDDEKTPEQVEDPIQENVEYYIEGIVSNGETGVAGVTVSTTGYEAVTTDANGRFTLTVDKAQDMTVDFSKDGFMGASATARLNGLTNRSVVVLAVQMNELAEAVTVPADTDVIIEPGNVTETDNDGEISNISEVGAYIPNEAVEGGTEVSMTSYVPESTIEDPAETNISSPVMAVYVETANGEVVASEENPVILAVNNPAENGSTRFQKMTVYKAATPATRAEARQSLGEANYDAATNSYQLVLTEGKLEGSYEFHVSTVRTEGENGTDVLGEGTVDNSGSFEAKNNIPIAYQARVGWDYKTPVESELAGLIEHAIVSYEGSKSLFSIDYETTTNLSGKSILYWKALGRHHNVKYTFNLNSGDLTVELTKYDGVDVTYTVVDANGHSGGTSTSNM